MKIGMQVVCNRPSQAGNNLCDGVIVSLTDTGAWVLVGQVERFFKRSMIVPDRAGSSPQCNRITQ